MTHAIRNDKISTPQPQTGHKSDGTRANEIDEAPAEPRAPVRTGERSEVDIARANALLARQTAGHGGTSNIRDRGQAYEAVAGLTAAMQKDSPGALGAYSALNPVAVEALLATPPK